MNTFNSLKCAAVLLPALALGMPMAYASDEKNDPCETDRTATLGTDRSQQHGEQRRDSTLAERSASASDADRTMTQRTAGSEYVENKPQRGFHSDNLVGHDVTNRRTDDTIGTVSNLVIDEDGKVVAVVIGVGGLMGIGERDVAISWDQLERTVDGDDIKLSVDMTEDSLKDAPKYSSDRKSASDRSRTSNRQ